MLLWDYLNSIWIEIESILCENNDGDADAGDDENYKGASFRISKFNQRGLGSKIWVQ